MKLVAKDLVEAKTAQLLRARSKISFQPGLALIWLGNDEQTSAFVKAKQQKAKLLNCQLTLHHLESASQRQLETIIKGLNNKDDVDGIVIQLPLPSSINLEDLLAILNKDKDIDNLTLVNRYRSPTPQGILELLVNNGIDPANHQTVILGGGRLIGKPLYQEFQRRHWPVTLIDQSAESQSAKIKQHNLLIAATGQKNLVSPAMVNSKMTVIDGSGIDADVEVIEPLVKTITPAKGAVGPLTVCALFANLFLACRSRMI